MSLSSISSQHFTCLLVFLVFHVLYLRQDDVQSIIINKKVLDPINNNIILLTTTINDDDYDYSCNAGLTSNS
jgi:hypothetical protein